MHNFIAGAVEEALESESASSSESSSSDVEDEADCNDVQEVLLNDSNMDSESDDSDYCLPGSRTHSSNVGDEEEEEYDSSSEKEGSGEESGCSD